MVKDFKDLGLDNKIIKALNNLGYKKPSKIQENIIPELLKGNDVIGKAKTGSRKDSSFWDSSL